MKHFLLKLSYGVEIGARLAYLGHYARTKNAEIFDIAAEEAQHQLFLRELLTFVNERPNKAINLTFKVIGKAVAFLCKYAPLWSLDLVASTMEVFAVFSYRKLADQYPQFKQSLLSMADTEDEHRRYFKYGTRKDFYKEIATAIDDLNKHDNSSGTRKLGASPALGAPYGVSCSYCKDTGQHLCPDVAEPILVECTNKNCTFNKVKKVWRPM